MSGGSLHAARAPRRTARRRIRNRAAATARPGRRRPPEQAWIAVHPPGLLELMAHELRTPVTSLYGATRLLERPGMPSWIRDDLLSEMALDAARLVRFLDDLLALAEATSGEVRTEPVLVDRLVSAVVLDLLATEDSRVSVAVDRASPVTPAMADPEALRHALRNLVRHAIRATPPGGEVRLEVGEMGGEVTVTIAERAARLETTGSAPVSASPARPLLDRHDRMVDPGGPLWLAAAQALVQAMGGELRTSQRPGGRRVRISLPAARAED